MTRVKPALLLASLALAGCGGGPPPTLYLLDARPPTAEPSREAGRIGLAEISLPAYARRDTIVSRTDGGRLVQHDDHRWAQPPAEALATALSYHLETQTRSTVVLSPYPRRLDPELQVRVTFDRLLRDRDGAAELRGQYMILADRADTVALVERFDIREAASAPSYGAYMEAVNAGLERLSVLIARGLRGIEQEARAPAR